MEEKRLEDLTSGEKAKFSQAITSLLTHTFVLKNMVDQSDGKIRRLNADYLFIYENFDLIDDYLSYTGFSIVRNDEYGIIYLSIKENSSVRLRLDKMTTLILYALRLIYEEKREDIMFGNEATLSVLDLKQKLISLGITKDKPIAASILHEALSTLSRFRLIDKGEGKWEDDSNILIIYPSILIAISQSSIKSIKDLLSEKESKIVKEEDEYETL